MSYLAIARKYRPATFDEIVGQEHVTRTLKNAIARGRIHHAYLFAGARGVGKTTAARALARALNCEKGPTANPCGVCPSCLEVTAGNSPDLIEIDGASNNSVDDIRDLRETVRYAPSRGKSKVYLIDEVHMLSKAAFNALLKTLEEPPPNVVFIFATTESNKIPETILSRCQRFDFKRISAGNVTAQLKSIGEREQVKLSDAALRRIARAGEGSMRDAQSLLDQVIAFCADGSGREITDADVVDSLGLIDRSLVYEMLGGLVAGAPDRCLDVIERVYGHGYELSEFTAEMLEVLRNATFIRLSPGARKYIDVSSEELDKLSEVTADVDADVLARAFQALLDVHDQVARAPRPRAVLEMAVARLATTRPVQPVGALLGRLEDLERRLRAQGAPAPVSGMRSQSSQRAPKSPSAKDADDEGAPARPRAKPAEKPVIPPIAGEAAPKASRAKTPVPPSDVDPDTAAALARHANLLAAKQAKAAAPKEPAKPRGERPSDSRDPNRAVDVAAAKPSEPVIKPGSRWNRKDTAAPTVDAWAAFQSDVAELSFTCFVDATAELQDGVLLIKPKPRFLGDCNRAVGDSGVAAALAARYPNGTRILVLGPEGFGPEQLLEKMQHDPAVRRIANLLGAKVTKATRLS